MDEPPKPWLAAANSDDEIAARETIRRLEWPLRKMAANLLRIARGAGRPNTLPQEIIDLAELILDASKHSNAWGIWTEIEAWLQEGVPAERDYDEYDDHRPAMVRGALQVVASRIVGQRAQENAGEHEILEGIRQREDRLEARRKKEAEAKRKPGPTIRASRPKAAVRKPTPKPPAPKRKEPPSVQADEAITTAEFMRRRAKGFPTPKGH